MQLDENISAVITGGASGLGEATARELAKHGVKCALFDLNAEKGEAVASDINGIFCEANVTEEDSVIAAFEKARAANGQERILINCAGTGIAIKTAAEIACISEVSHQTWKATNSHKGVNVIAIQKCNGKS